MKFGKRFDSEHLLQGQRRALGKAITLVESRLLEDRREAERLLQCVLPHTGNSLRIGISGTPGVGKSTFIEALGLHLTSQGKRLAVLAVDPSSPITGGSILGDKTRMEMLSREQNAFIRPSPASGQLGGVAQKTREAMLLCEAAGFDVILVETVGVGQSEFDVAGMVDFFLVLMQPNGGDDLQGIKKGILELANALVINKADGEGKIFADQAKSHYLNALQLVKKKNDPITQVLTCSALEGTNIDAVWAMLAEFEVNEKEAGRFLQHRAQQNRVWMQKLFDELLEQKLQMNREFTEKRGDLSSAVANGELTPLSAAQQLLALLK